MNIRTFAFDTTHTNNLQKFMTMCISRHYNFEVYWEDDTAIVEVNSISEADADAFADDETVNDEDMDCDYEAPDDLELGFNPYIGCYDYDC